MLGPLATISEPAVEPIELGSAKRFLRVDGTAQDDDIRMLIGAARRDLEQTTGQRLIEQTVRIRAFRFSDLAVLPVGPVMAIVDITYLDGAERKSVDLETVYLTGAGLERGIDLVPGYSWPAHTRGPIVVDLKVGYGPTGASVPENLRWAMFALMRGKFDDRAVDIEGLVVNDRIYG
ncbi:head-tail connector protein [Sphingomonas sp. Ag1]|uniref:head-tail connector protein n=1 Tax=Sphingomonas sp. Ag1 TaxID=1642949 RepID=UPI000621C016|nr:phage head-tail connector protein [Sphingomonas sp. Ag1]KKI17494.1 hypothetical protein XM50_14390 [Sphingomonas sp. Ag1]